MAMCWPFGRPLPEAEALQSFYPECFDRDMACTQAEWLRWLPDAIGAHPWQASASGATVLIGSGTLTLAWHAGPARVIALMRLPSWRVHFAFADLNADARQQFMSRFDLYMQRGGG